MVDQLRHSILNTFLSFHWNFFRPNPVYQRNTEPEILQNISAKRLVIFRCRATSTPLILERSGIGISDILKQVGVPLVADIKGDGAESVLRKLDVIHSGRVDFGDPTAAHDKRLRYNAIVVQAKLRPFESDVDTLRPAIRSAWDEHFKYFTNKRLMMIWMDVTHREVARQMGCCEGPHLIGTCKLVPRGKNGVVDETLIVYGLQGLKVADLSITPQIIGAADLFIKELGFGK
ncbi:FAD/NAD(P)-binding domain-containing protein [Xylariaceae sp. FL0255]|nr:FAD/NAD(P)-binding domain-containing protein [Xylariaceae sp. FL0255]